MMSAAMLKPSRPLPRRFNRPVTQKTRSFVERRMERRKRYGKERMKRLLRRAQKGALDMVLTLRKWLWLVLFLFLVLVVVVGLFSPLLRVREIRVRRTDTRLDSERIQQALAPVFGKHLLFLSPHEVSLLVRQALPDVSSVSVHKQYPSTLALEVTLQPLVARLLITQPAAVPSGTGSALVAGTGSGADYLTDAGIDVSLPFVYQDAALPTITVMDWGARPVPGAQLVSPSLLQRMRDAEGMLREQFGFQVVGRTLYLRAREFHLRSTNVSLWFDMKGTLDEQLSRFRLFLKNVSLNKVTRYVDLRLSGRIVYR